MAYNDACMVLSYNSFATIAQIKRISAAFAGLYRFQKKINQFCAEGVKTAKSRLHFAVVPLLPLFKIKRMNAALAGLLRSPFCCVDLTNVLFNQKAIN